MTDYSDSHWDLVVIGGGAAGFFGAIAAAESAYDAQRILIVEKSAKLLGKVRISGGGRCNVTHACFDPRTFSTHYPRGEKELIGPLNRWSSQDTIDWFHSHGVTLKTERDGRMFPTTDDSQTIIDCLETRAAKLNITIWTQAPVSSVTHHSESEDGFAIEFNNGTQLSAKKILMAPGGTRSSDTVRLIESLGHNTLTAVPSLFTFNINDTALTDLAGLSVAPVVLAIPQLGLESSGPLLVTHWGLSGPSILKLSAWGARKLHSVDYEFELSVNWLPETDIPKSFETLRTSHGKRAIAKYSPFSDIPRRLWERFVQVAGISSTATWSRLSKTEEAKLVQTLCNSRFNVSGKSMNKEEFVTCGGVELTEVSLKTMESRRTPGLFFAGEVLNIDGITGGFNFQNAWTTGRLAGIAISKA